MAVAYTPSSCGGTTFGVLPTRASGQPRLRSVPFDLYVLRHAAKETGAVIKPFAILLPEGERRKKRMQRGI